MMTNEQKIEIYEELLHRIQLYAEVTLDYEKLNNLIRNICRWSYAHRVGNGYSPIEELDKRIENATKKLLER